MPVRTADAEWKGDLKGGKGSMKLGSGAFEGAYSFRSRMEDGSGTNPEELIAAAHAGCFSMQLSAMLAHDGHPPKSVATTAKVNFQPEGAGFAITGIELDTKGEVPGIDAAAFEAAAQKAKEICPVSKALKAVPITLKTSFVG